MGYISSKGVDVIRILYEIVTKKVYLDFYKMNLSPALGKFGFIDPVNPNKFY